jgi:hypothetical protein
VALPCLLTNARWTYAELGARVDRLDAGYWGLRLIHWIHTVLGAVALVPWNPKRQRNRACLPPTWTAEELGKRTSSERFFGRVFSRFSLFRLQRPRRPHRRGHPRRRPGRPAGWSSQSDPFP